MGLNGSLDFELDIDKLVLGNIEIDPWNFSGSLPHSTPSNELYYDESTGLIEIVGVPKPPEAPVDYMVEVREQLETMLAEWESFTKSDKPFSA